MPRESCALQLRPWWRPQGQLLLLVSGVPFDLWSIFL